VNHKNSSTLDVGTLADALDAQAKALAATAAALRGGALSEASVPKYFDQATSPLSKRVFLDHARRGSFPTKRVGKRVLVERDVFDRWLALQGRPRLRVPDALGSGPRSLDRDVADELGLVASGSGR
jgi:hypothetical protein